MKAIATTNEINSQRNLEGIERLPTFPHQCHHLSPQSLAGLRLIAVAVFAIPRP